MNLGTQPLGTTSNTEILSNTTTTKSGKPTEQSQTNFEGVLASLADKNGDGTISSAEVSDLFKAADIDKNGILDNKEFAALFNTAGTGASGSTTSTSTNAGGTLNAGPTIAEYKELLTSADTNKDGKVTSQELNGILDAGPRAVERNFNSADANKDGKLTGAEQDPFLKTIVPPDLANDRKTLDAVAGAFDTNADGAIDQAEVLAISGGGYNTLVEAFTAADTNKDGTVDAKELNSLNTTTSSTSNTASNNSTSSTGTSNSTSNTSSSQPEGTSSAKSTSTSGSALSNASAEKSSGALDNVVSGLSNLADLVQNSSGFTEKAKGQILDKIADILQIIPKLEVGSTQNSNATTPSNTQNSSPENTSTTSGTQATNNTNNSSSSSSTNSKSNYNDVLTSLSDFTDAVMASSLNSTVKNKVLDKVADILSLLPRNSETLSSSSNALNAGQSTNPNEIRTVGPDSEISSDQARIAGNLKELDTNKDGKVSRAELNETVSRGPGDVNLKFDRADVDKNGVLEGEETKNFFASVLPERNSGGPQRLDAPKGQYDTNMDGVITRQELQNAAINSGAAELIGGFNAADTNRDNVLDSSELSAFAKSSAPVVEKTSVSTSQPSTTPDGVNTANLLKNFDVNSDGQVTRQEMNSVIEAGPNGVARSFDSADTNKDGVLKGDEATTFLKTFIPSDILSSPALTATDINELVSDVKKTFDTNNDGNIDKAESVAATQQNSQSFVSAFEKADTNRDNVVDASELQALGGTAQANTTSQGTLETPGQGSLAEFVSGLDINKDGQVTLAEAQKPIDQAYSLLDAAKSNDINKDGVLSGAELAPFLTTASTINSPQLNNLSLKTFDSNSNGTIESAELTNFVASVAEEVNQIFKLVDDNSDNTLSASEIANADADSATSGAQSVKSQTTVQDLFNSIDTDKDGKISEAELNKALSTPDTAASTPDSLFAKIDTNKDGSINEEELSKALG